ncbi:hypothetical protein [Streptomyces sp. NPDC088725]|uniref:hypothetical protein n=1 Tax=Streptomyces sp. NPDC088725 TaxID=3365873 RepID=UPI00381B06E6
MTPMRRGLVHVLAWLLATGAAVTLSWWGVHTVMAGTAYDPPRALPIPADGVRAGDAPPLSSSTRRPESPAEKPAPSPTKEQDGADDRHTATPPPAQPPRTASPSGGAPDPSPPDTVRSYTVDGGRVVFDLGEQSAELVSATPDAGWRMQVWTEPAWIRVTFTRDGREVSVFCTWNGHAPTVEFDDSQGR